jgi:hypothetical protein
MTLLYSHDVRMLETAASHRSMPRRAFKRIRAAFRMIHSAIAAAKIHRLRNELLLRGHGDWAPTGDRHIASMGADAERYPRQPVVLGEKWDY